MTNTTTRPTAPEPLVTDAPDTIGLGSARSQQAGHSALISPPQTSRSASETIYPPSGARRAGADGRVYASIAHRQAAGLEALQSLAMPVEAVGLDPGVVELPASARRRLAIPLPLVIILTVQAVLSARFFHANTAFGDEALYLWAGHLEWSHWLHGMHIPAFPTWFSGSPVIYPPIGALADTIGGLAGARVLSLCFMLGTTCLLWCTASRLSGRRQAFFAAALFAAIGPTLHLGAFATYDSMALFLLALAAWCACGGRTSEDATGWIIAAAGALALANAAKYASAIFDPIVVAMAVLSAYPQPGGKVALRRGALLPTCLTGALAILLRLGGPWYLTGIGLTTTMRPNGGVPIALVLADSWQWTAVVVVTALAGVALSILKGNARSRTLLIAALAAAALLVAAGWALSRLVAWLRPRYAKIMAMTCLCAALIAVAATGSSQAQEMVNWPGAANLIAFLRPVTSNGGRFLAETDDVPEYYLPQTSWRQWSNTFSITLPNGQQENVGGRPAPYARAIRQHYFSLIILSFSETAALDHAITRVLRATPGYRVIGIVPYGGPVPGNYTVWAYRPHAQHGAT